MKLLPDETIYSLIARINLLAINKRTDDFYESLLGCIYTQACGVSTYRLETLAADLEISVTRLLNEHTSYRYFAHFMSAEHRERFRDALTGNSAEALESLAGTATSRLGIPPYHAFCPRCSEKAIEMHGVSYWHQFHELPGVTACHVHGIKLIRSSVRPKHLDLPDIQNSHATRASEKEILFARLSVKLLEEAAEPKTYGSMADNYKFRLDACGYVTPKGMIRSTQLLDDLRRFWGDLLLQDDFQHVRTDGSKHNFIRDLLRSGDKRTHPVKHILLTDFLDSVQHKPEVEPPVAAPGLLKGAGSTELAVELLKQGISLSKTAEQSGVSYYSVRKLAHEYEIPINHKPGKLPADKELEVLGLLEQGLSMKKIGEMVGMSESGIDNILSAHPGLREKRRNVRKQNKSDKREQYRRKALEIIDENPELHRKALFDKFPDIFVWLRNHDRQWLYQYLPPPCSATAAQSYRYDQQGAMWMKRQQAAIKQLRKFARKSLSQPPAGQRMSISFILKSLKVRNNQGHIRDRMPWFWHQLSKVSESHEEYQLRKLHALHTENPTYFKTYSIIRILKFARSFPPVSERVLRAARSLAGKKGTIYSPEKRHLLILRPVVYMKSLDLAMTFIAGINKNKSANDLEFFAILDRNVKRYY